MTERNRDILNAIPLVEVMRGWGYTAKRQNSVSAWYLCPWHDDHNPSLEVRKQPLRDAEDLSFKCWACKQEGFGAIQLAARLMGLSPGKLSNEDLPMVLVELATRCDVELEPDENDGKPWKDSLRTKVMGWDEFKVQEPQYAGMTDGDTEFEPGYWTEQGLKSLGLKVELASRKAKKTDVSEGSEIKIGDIITEYDADSGAPLYRCSLGAGFYGRPEKAETKTIEQWGEELHRLFGVEPISRFITRKTPGQGGAIAIVTKSTRNYPIFIFRYPWGTKKYEPKDSTGKRKWWWSIGEDADVDHRWYADSELKDFMDDGVIPHQDEYHPMVTTEKEEGGKKIKTCRFRRVVLCSGPRDAIAVWSHSDAHVVWLHSELSGFNRKEGAMRPNRWLRSFVRKLLSVTAEGGLYICYDEDAPGLAASQAIALNNPQVHWLRLPKELTEIYVKNKPLKDVTDFITHFQEVEGRMPADLQHDDPVDWFDNALFDTPTTKFWQWESARKDADGSERARYKFDMRNTPVFLRARGLVRRVMKLEDGSVSRFFLLGSDNIYSECFPGEKGTANRLVQQARDLMADWLRAHKEFNDPKGALSRAIYSAKLEQSALESIEIVDFNDRSYGEDFDHFFFENTAVLVTKEGWKTVGYEQLKWWTNADAILDGVFTPIKQQWRVELNPFYDTERQAHEAALLSLKTQEEQSQENMRWDAWASVWKYRLMTDKPIDEMPVHFRFLYNTCRIFWEKEAAGEELSKTERQMQDMYFITMLHALGSALVRHRSANRQQFLHITDNGTRREDLASGGTGKSAILELLALMRRVLRIDGKSLEGGNIMLEQELGKVVPGLHNIVAIDELPDKFSPKKMYNYPLSLTSRGLYKGSVKLEGDDLPKFVVASNEQLDLSSDSTSRRIYQMLVCDWYHPRSMDGSRPAHTPADDFRKDTGIKEVAHNLPPTLLNEARNLLLGCVQLFLQFPDETIRPPKDSRALLRQALAASKDEQFTRWIASYLADKRHIGIPIAHQELAISLLDYCGITVGEKTMKAAMKRIRDNMDDYLRTSIYVMNPPVVLRTPTDREKGFRRCATWMHQMNADGTIQTDKQGKRLPRVLEKKIQPKTYYFYRKGYVPRHFYEEGHEGDKDYVQAAPEMDPEGVEL